MNDCNFCHLANFALSFAMFGGSAIVGLPIAGWGYPWRKPRLRPYIWIALILLAPLAGLLLLHTFFSLPAGTCSDRLLGGAPWLLAIANLASVIALLVVYPGRRRFIAGMAVAICPTMLLWTPITIMSLVGCWI